jgi:hypothetical protein
MRKQRTDLIFVALLTMPLSLVYAQTTEMAKKPQVTRYDRHTLGETIEDFMRISGTEMCRSAALQPKECEKLKQIDAGKDAEVTQGFPYATVSWLFVQRTLVQVILRTSMRDWEAELARTEQQLYGPPDIRTARSVTWLFKDGGEITLGRDQNNFVNERYFSKETAPHRSSAR